jgi:geranylgeranylglycerol-phosphate geranylgeranyltransferase
VRPSATLPAFLSIFIPAFARTTDLTLSLRRAIPVLFASICTFLSNDLDDIEKDKINHPLRPLPSGHLTTAFVATLYYASLTLALVTTRHFIVSTRISFLYYLLLILCISYHYIVEYLPELKAVYVAATSSIPILILIAYYPAETALHWIAPALFALMFGREVCKDLLDRAGDTASLLHKIPAKRMARIAFSSHAIGLILLAGQVVNVYLLIGFFGMAAILAQSYRAWFHHERDVTAIRLMQISMFLGLFFLL